MPQIQRIQSKKRLVQASRELFRRTRRRTHYLWGSGLRDIINLDVPHIRDSSRCPAGTFAPHFLQYMSALTAVGLATPGVLICRPDLPLHTMTAAANATIITPPTMIRLFCWINCKTQFDDVCVEFSGEAVCVSD